MQTVAQSWLVYRMTNSAFLLGAVGFASQIPVFIMAPIGGIVADRFRRQRVVIATQVASMILAAILAALTLTPSHPGMAGHGAGRPAGRGQCIRHSRAAGFPHRHGRPRRPDERHRPELVHVQRRAHHRPGGRGNSGGLHRRRLVLLRQRGQLHRGHRRIAADANPARGQAGDLGIAAGKHSRRVCLCAGQRPVSADPAAARPGELCRNALCRVDAGLRRPDPARRRQRPRHPDGRDRYWRSAGSGQSGRSRRRERAWAS